MSLAQERGAVLCDADCLHLGLPYSCTPSFLWCGDLGVRPAVPMVPSHLYPRQSLSNSPSGLAWSPFVSSFAPPTRPERASARTPKTLPSSTQECAWTSEVEDTSDEDVDVEKTKLEERRAGNASVICGSQDSTSSVSRSSSAEWNYFCHFTDPGTEVECGAGFVRPYDLKRVSLAPYLPPGLTCPPPA